MKLTKRTKIIIVVLILAGGVFLWARPREGLLPKNAEIVYSTEQHDGFLPDGSMKIKARIRESDFPGVVKRLGASLHAPQRKYSDDILWLDWSPEIGTDFKPVIGVSKWNPTSDLSATYVSQEGDSWEYVKFEDGYLFYKYINH